MWGEPQPRMLAQARAPRASGAGSGAPDLQRTGAIGTGYDTDTQ